VRFQKVGGGTTLNVLKAQKRKGECRESNRLQEQDEAKALNISVIALKAKKAQEVEDIIKKSRATDWRKFFGRDRDR
jgi:hypothetical protein